VTDDGGARGQVASPSGEEPTGAGIGAAGSKDDDGGSRPEATSASAAAALSVGPGVVTAAGLETAVPKTTMPPFSLRNLPAGGSRDERRGVELMEVVLVEAERRRGPRRTGSRRRLQRSLPGRWSSATPDAGYGDWTGRWGERGCVGEPGSGRNKGGGGRSRQISAAAAHLPGDGRGRETCFFPLLALLATLLRLYLWRM
jgi:hypothetical protein